MTNTQTFDFGPWTVTSTKGTILNADTIERFTAELKLPSLPEMVFGDNCLCVQHQSGFGLEFNALDALRLVNSEQDLLKVACAEDWQKSRANGEQCTNIVKPFDWTFTTSYTGTLIEKGDMKFKVVETDEMIDLEVLKKKEKIYFYEDMILFEDELADNGCALLSVKMRIMQGSFFILLRFYLRVDDVIVRVNDTRIHYVAGNDYFMREYTSREESTAELKDPYEDARTIYEKLGVKFRRCEKLQFPESVCAEQPLTTETAKPSEDTTDS
ncbi:TIP41-like protein [Xenia sp. Carnegie-2017]|uniref:TIP41-like protein n=1 Tax=Xenia sp. Carnegie-2017 TaxID=2897299 RepID=UPI001F0380DA|nr:TIP41-like protein [Xenia sp. Carnegie-2017]